MPRFNALRRFAALGWPDRVLLAEAVFALAAASLAIRLLPFRIVSKVAASVGGRNAQQGIGTEPDVTRIRWAVEACARRLPWKIVCFQKGVALHAMLRLRGHPTILHYGVAQDPQRGLAAHVWVTQNGEPVIGGEEAGRFTCLATYPPALAEQVRS